MPRTVPPRQPPKPRRKRPDRPAPAASPFEDDARRALDALRRSLAAILDCLPPGRDRAVDLQRALDLDPALAWQIHTLSSAADPLSAGRVVPKAGAMDRFFLQARAKRIPAARLDAARRAYTDFELTVAHHAGARSTFDAMLSALRPDDGPTLKRLRKAAHHADAAVWGLSVKLRLNCVVFHERPTGQHDCLSLRARIGVRCLREGATIAIYASGLTWGGPGPAPSAAPGVAADRCELLHDFCAGPVPRLASVRAPDGRPLDHLELHALGRSQEVSVYWRNLSLDFPGGSSAPPHGCTAECLEPTELTVMDLLVPKGWTSPASARCSVTALAGLHGPLAARSAFPFEGRAVHLGSRLEDLHLRQAPRYVEALARSLEQRRWDPHAFDLYRCEIAYPILHTALHLRVDGPGTS